MTSEIKQKFHESSSFINYILAITAWGEGSLSSPNIRQDFLCCIESNTFNNMYISSNRSSENKKIEAGNVNSIFSFKIPASFNTSRVRKFREEIVAAKDSTFMKFIFYSLSFLIQNVHLIYTDLSYKL